MHTCQHWTSISGTPEHHLGVSIRSSFCATLQTWYQVFKHYVLINLVTNLFVNNNYDSNCHHFIFMLICYRYVAQDFGDKGYSKFHGYRELTSFFSWLDYCDTLMKVFEYFHYFLHWNTILWELQICSISLGMPSEYSGTPVAYFPPKVFGGCSRGRRIRPAPRRPRHRCTRQVPQSHRFARSNQRSVLSSLYH